MAQPAAAVRTLRFGSHALPLGGQHLGELRDANDLLDDLPALAARLREDGYLLVRGLHDRDLVLEARRQMLDRVAAAGMLDPDQPVMDGVIAAKVGGNFFGGSNDLTGAPAFQDLVRSARVMDFFARLRGGPAMTYDFQWLRLVGNGESTGAHMDKVYMGRGTPDVLTCWSPIGDVSFDMGPLAICVGSHASPEFARVRETYGRMDVDRDRVGGWFSDDPVEIVERFGGRWATSEFRAGDALIFGMLTMHASLVNVSPRYRLSADTRYQLAAEPADERWIGAKPIGHYNWTAGPQVPMEEKRKEWGI